MVNPCFKIVQLGAGDEDLPGKTKARIAAVLRIAVGIVLVRLQQAAVGGHLGDDAAALIRQQVTAGIHPGTFVTNDRVIVAKAMNKAAQQRASAVILRHQLIAVVQIIDAFAVMYRTR